MKLNDFRDELRRSLERICKTKSWNFDNNKQRGMAFEDWCFELLAERHPTAENDPSECIIRSDDSEIDIVGIWQASTRWSLFAMNTCEASSAFCHLRTKA